MAGALTAIGSFIGANAGTIATVASVGSSVIGGIGAIQSANAQADTIEANAALMEQQAQERRVASSVEAERLRRRQRQMLASERAGAAQAGVLSGTSLDLLNQNSVAAELDAMTVEYGGRQQARGIEAQAAVDRAEAPGVRRAGYFSGASHFAQGASRLAFDPMNMTYSSTNAPVL